MSTHREETELRGLNKKTDIALHWPWNYVPTMSCATQKTNQRPSPRRFAFAYLCSRHGQQPQVNPWPENRGFAGINANHDGLFYLRSQCRLHPAAVTAALAMIRGIDCRQNLRCAPVQINSRIGTGTAKYMTTYRICASGPWELLTTCQHGCLKRMKIGRKPNQIPAGILNGKTVSLINHNFPKLKTSFQ